MVKVRGLPEWVVIATNDDGSEDWLVHLVIIGDSVGPLRRTESDLRQLHQKWGLGFIGNWRESGSDASRPSRSGEEDILPAHKASPVQLTTEHERELNELVRAHSTPQKLAERARIILLAAAGLGVEETAYRLGIWRKTASHWRRRWREAAASAGVAARLSDAPRCGAPATFTPEVICQIMALACEDPETLSVPISHWSQSELARQSVARGIVKSISHGSVGRFLKKRPISSRIATGTG